MCPAAGPNPNAACPLKPDSLRGPSIAVRVQIRKPPEHPDRACTNKSSISLPIVAGAKYRQEFAYGTPEWQAHFSLRNTVEGFNGYVKDPNHEALSNAGRRRIRGLPAQYLFASILIAAANIRKIRAWVLAKPISVATSRRRHERRRQTRHNARVATAARANSPPAA